MVGAVLAAVALDSEKDAEEQWEELEAEEEEGEGAS